MEESVLRQGFLTWVCRIGVGVYCVRRVEELLIISQHTCDLLGCGVKILLLLKHWLVRTRKTP